MLEPIVVSFFDKHKLYIIVLVLLIIIRRENILLRVESEGEWGIM